MWATGARGTESINIKISDIYFKNHYIRIPNKIFKGQEETLLLSSVAMDIVKQIIALEKGKDGRLFSWKRTITPIQNLENLENKLGVKIKKRGLHGFRRSFITRLFTKDFSIDKVQEIARHQRIDTTIGHYKEFNKKKLISEMNEKL
jgi:integrase